MKSSLKVSDKQSIIEKLQRHCSCLNMHIIYIKKRYKKSCTLIKQPKSTESFPCFCQPFVSSYSSVIVFSPENKKYLPGKEFVCIKYRRWHIKNYLKYEIIVIKKKACKTSRLELTRTAGKVPKLHPALRKKLK